MKIYFEKDNKEIDFNIKSKTKILNIILEFNLNLNEIIIVKNKKIVLEDEFCENDDKIEFLNVVSGG